MSSVEVKKFLNQHDIKYQTITHSLAYTATEVAQALELTEERLAKSVIIDLDHKKIMAVIPAHYKIDLEWVKKATKSQHASFAHEAEFVNQFPDCDIGAIPPFGNLYQIPVYVAPELAKEDFITFNAGSYFEVIKMKYADYARLVNPQVVPLVLER